MVRSVTLLLFIFFSENIIAQKQDTANALQQVQSKLQSGSTIEQILTDNHWMFLHAKSEFRFLIKKFAAADELTIITPAENGNKITVVLLVKNEQGEPIPNLLVYCYHTDNRGFYAFDTTHVFGQEGDRRHARLFGYIKSDANGKIIMHTIHPVGYPKSVLPSHIHCEVEAEGYLPVITEFRFDEDPRLTPEQRKQTNLEGFLIAKSDNGYYQYQIILKKDNHN